MLPARFGTWEGGTLPPHGRHLPRRAPARAARGSSLPFRPLSLQEHFTRMRAELQLYSQSKDLPRLLDAALPLLQPHQQLLEGFAAFVPRAARTQLQQRVQRLLGAQPGGTAAAGKASGMAARHQQLQQPSLAAPAGPGAAAPLHQAGRPAQAQQPAAGAVPNARQPLAQQPQPRHVLLPQQQQQQHKQSKLQQLLGGAVMRPQAGAGGSAARPGGAAAGTTLQQQRGSGGGMLMPPRGMQQVALPRSGQQLMQQRPPQASGARPGSGAGVAPVAPLARPSSKARGPPCAVCGKAPMDAPHQASCGHSACYTCWLTALAKFSCPVCSRGVRKNQLTKMHFA